MAIARPAELPAAGAMLPRPFVVAARERETADTWTLTLEPAAGEMLVVAPGQFVMAYAFGVGEVPISVSGASGSPGSVVLTIRAVGAVTRALCARRAGAVVGLRGPFGTSWPIDEAASGDVVVVAGGIGLAPLRPVVQRAVARRADYGHVSLLYGARTPDDLLYPAQLAEWGGSLTVAVTVDAARGGWQGHVGVVPKLVAGAAFAAERATAFVCGPELMMHFAVAALLDRGVPPERVFVSLERHMDCGVGLCGHCQLGTTLVCRDGPVYAWPQVAHLLRVREL